MLTHEMILNRPVAFVAERRRARSGIIVLFVALNLCAWLAAAQDLSSSARLSRGNFKNGEETLRAFEPVCKGTRHYVVKVDVYETTAGLAAVMDATRLPLTKASELKDGKVSGWAFNGT